MSQISTIKYDEIASMYSENRNASPTVIGHILSSLKAIHPQRILEIGCGTADHLFLLCEAWNSKGFGFDSSKGMIREGNKKNPGLNLRVGNAEAKFPVSDGEFGFAFSIDVVHYIGNLINFYLEAWKVLEANGVLLTVTDSTEDLSKRTMAKYFPETIESEMKRYHPIDTLKSVMSEVGFKNIKTSHIERPFKINHLYVENVSRKAFSALRLIPGDRFKVGLERLIQEERDGRAFGNEVNTFVWGMKLN